MKEALNRLFNKLYFPIGGYEEETDTIWMSENSTTKLVATKTATGIVCIAYDGTILHLDTVEEMEAAFVAYFTGNGLQKIIPIDGGVTK